MLSSVVAAFALAAVSNVAATPINHVARGYAQDAELLEDYTPYHVRYLALKCHEQHNSQFFEDCCHPLLRWQKLSDRPAKCIPSASASSSAVLAEPTSAPIDEDPIPEYDDDCEEATSYVAPAAVTSASNYVAPAAVTSSVVTVKAKSEAVPTTSVYQVPSPEPTTSKAQSYEPETTSYQAPVTTAEPPHTTSAAAPTTSAAPSGGDGAFTGGFATFFTQNGNAGACGDKHDDYDLIVAADYRRYGDLGKQSDLCGKKVVITNTNNGKTVTAIVADACPSCVSNNSLDLSLGAFDKIATREEGMVPISWYFA